MSSGKNDAGDPGEIDPKDAQALYQALHAEADKLANCGSYTEAIDKYTRALLFHPNQLDCLVSRAKCYMMTGNTEASLSDVNQVLNLSPSFIRAIYQKAETLYAQGDFENALVLFHRGRRARPEVVGFEIGIHKCVESIRAAVVLLDTDKIRRRLDAVRRKSIHSQDGGSQGPPTVVAGPTTGTVKKDAFAKAELSSLISVKSSNSALQAERNLIEDLQDDKLFLLNMLSDVRLCAACDGDIGRLVQEGLNYIETRVDFWRQGNPSGVDGATVKAAILGSRLNLGHDEIVGLKEKRRATVSKTGPSPLIHDPRASSLRTPRSLPKV